MLRAMLTTVVLIAATTITARAQDDPVDEYYEAFAVRQKASKEER